MADLVGKRRVTLLVHAHWCPHCRAITDKRSSGRPSIWDSVKAGLPGRKFVELDSDEAARIAQSSRASPLQTVLRSVASYPFIAVIEKVTKNNEIPIRVFPPSTPRNVRNLTRFITTA